jgi:hypothetical protein
MLLDTAMSREKPRLNAILGSGHARRLGVRRRHDYNGSSTLFQGFRSLQSVMNPVE